MPWGRPPQQSKIGGFVTPTLARTVRRPGQPSVKAVSSVVSLRPTVSRVRWINAVRSVSALATAPKTWRPPSAVSTLPTRTSKWRSPSSQLRMKVESKLIVIAAVAAGGFCAAASASCLPTCSVWLRNVSGLVPASTGSRCCSTSAATRNGISADSRACSWFSSGVDRQCGGQLTPVSPQPQPAHRNRGSFSLTSPNSVAIRCGCQSFTLTAPAAGTAVRPKRSVHSIRESPAGNIPDWSYPNRHDPPDRWTVPLQCRPGLCQSGMIPQISGRFQRPAATASLSLGDLVIVPPPRLPPNCDAMTEHCVPRMPPVSGISGRLSDRLMDLAGQVKRLAPVDHRNPNAYGVTNPSCQRRSRRWPGMRR
jgi:hypothetical protein